MKRPTDSVSNDKGLEQRSGQAVRNGSLHNPTHPQACPRCGDAHPYGPPKPGLACASCQYEPRTPEAEPTEAVPSSVIGEICYLLGSALTTVAMNAHPEWRVQAKGVLDRFTIRPRPTQAVVRDFRAGQRVTIGSEALVEYRHRCGEVVDVHMGEVHVQIDGHGPIWFLEKDVYPLPMYCSHCSGLTEHAEHCPQRTTKAVAEEPKACQPDRLCWRAQELIAEAFGIEEGIAPGKSTAEAIDEIRKKLARLAKLEACTDYPGIDGDAVLRAVDELFSKYEESLNMGASMAGPEHVTFDRGMVRAATEIREAVVRALRACSETVRSSAERNTTLEAAAIRAERELESGRPDLIPGRIRAMKEVDRG